MRSWYYIVAGVAVVGVVAVAWWIRQPEEVVEEPFQPRESHQVYREALDQLAVADTAMGRAWITAADESMHAVPGITPPLTETVHLDPRDPGAVSYWFPVTRGRQIVIDLQAEHDYYFADVYRLAEDGGADGSSIEVEELVASRPEGEEQIVFEARSNGFYLFRLQPELLRGGRFQISISERASLAFPVEGASDADIWSYFGDGRDAGTREHHGVDIFAPRGTPVLAVSDSEVVRVGERERGGNIVTLRDDARNIMLYYAHLDEQLTTTGARVSAGDVIGTVGNTGNAISTPPHLHIGIYQGGWRRPVDPWGYFVDPPEVTPAAASEEGADRVGTWVVAPVRTVGEGRIPAGSTPVARAQNRNPYLRGAGDTFAGAESVPDPELQPPSLHSISIEAGTPLRVEGVAGEHVRVRSLQGETGFIPISNRLMDAAVDRTTLSDEYRVRDIVSGDTIATMPAGETVVRLADIGGGEVVQLDSGRVVVLTPES
ncbi:MAG: peptidoglycan DD-metalloendopeptidase family protein [Alkalispirochaeta sp.]